MRVALCGRVALVALDGREVLLSRPQLQASLAVLVLERHRSLTREELAHLLWGDALSAHWKGALRGVVAKLRAALAEAGADPGVLRTSGGLVELALPEGAVVDVDEAREAVRSAEAVMASGLPSEAARRAEAAVGVLERRFLPAVELPWADERRWELAALRRRGERVLGRARLGEGRPADAVEVARRLVADDPFDDAARALLLRGLGAVGDLGGVRLAYDDYVRLLRDELGVGPTAELTAVRDALLATEHRASTPDRPGGGLRPDPDGGPPFVGRDDVLAELLAALPVAGSRRASLLVLEGEPGAGKTRLAAEVVGATPIRSMWGRCTPHPRFPFEPVTEALAGLWATDPTAQPRLEDLRTALAPLAVDGRPSAAGRASGADERPALFRAVATAVHRLTDEPLVWVVDDLQWADPDSVALLVHVLTEVAGRPLALVATARERPPELAAALAHVGRTVPVRIHRVEGLDADSVADWLGRAGIRGADDLAARVHRRTGGNPLFVAELVAAARAGDGRLDPDVVPAALQELLAGRLAVLAPEHLTVLEVAALAGDVVDPGLLVEVTGFPPARVDVALRALAREHLLVEGADGLRAPHDVVQEVVVDSIGPTRRSWLHLRLAAVLESRPPFPGRTTELARHFTAAGPGHGDDARRWTLASAREAADRGAWSTAGRMADEVLAERSASPADRVGALVVRGRARRGLGDAPEAEDALDAAVDLARLHDLPRAFAAAVLECAGGGGRGVPDAARFRRVGLVEEALAALGEGDDDLRVPLLGSLAVALLLTDRDDERRAAAGEALALARRSGDPGVMARALLDHRFALGADRAEQRCREADEALALGERSRLPEVVSAALAYRQEDLLLLGERASAQAALQEAAAHLDRFPDPYWTWVVDTWGALHLVLDGRFDDAEEAVADAAARAGDHPHVAACRVVSTVGLRMSQRRGAEVVDLLDHIAAANGHVPAYRAVLALARAQAGDLGGAAAVLGGFAADDFASVPDDTNRLLTVAALADVAVAVGDASVVPPLRAELERHGGLHVVLNCYGGGGTVWGPVSSHLADLCRLAGDRDAATHWHRRALADARRAGDRPFLDRLDADGLTA